MCRNETAVRARPNLYHYTLKDNYPKKPKDNRELKKKKKKSVFIKG